jgi:hypothetical protein
MDILYRSCIMLFVHYCIAKIRLSKITGFVFLAIPHLEFAYCKLDVNDRILPGGCIHTLHFSNRTTSILHILARR